MIKEYLAYIKDNPKGYWFKRKLYGWGWTPVKWQGWFVVGAFVIVLVLATNFFLMEGKVVEYSVAVVSAGVMVIVLGYVKGEKPRWQWGPHNKNEPEV